MPRVAKEERVVGGGAYEVDAVESEDELAIDVGELGAGPTVVRGAHDTVVL